MGACSHFRGTYEITEEFVTKTKGLQVGSFCAMKMTSFGFFKKLGSDSACSIHIYALRLIFVVRSSQNDQLLPTFLPRSELARTPIIEV